VGVTVIKIEHSLIEYLPVHDFGLAFGCA